MDRRSFLISSFAVPLYAAIPLTVLSRDEARVVEALCARIIPADEFPGAKEAGVVYYRNAASRPLARFTPHYKSGIPNLNKPHA